MYLTGSRTHNLDAKMRLTLPADVRRQFEDKVYLVALPDAVYGFTPEGHKAWVDSMFPEGYNPRSKRDSDLRLAINARTAMVDIDSAGRVSLSKMDEDVLAKLGREIEVIGNDDHFELWNAEEWAKQRASFSDEVFNSLLFDE